MFHCEQQNENPRSLAHFWGFLFLFWKWEGLTPQASYRLFVAA